MVTRGIPFVHLKTACSLDGRIATRTGESKWITGEQSRAASQALRHEYDAILVGINTALNDNPLLSDRTGAPRHRPLVRVVLDAGLRLPPHSQLVQTARELPLLVFAAEHEILDSMGFPIYTEWGNTLEERKAKLQDLGVRIVQIPVDGAQLKLPSVLHELGQQSLTSVLIEGGAEVAASFIEARLVDKLTFFMAPKIIGGRDAKSVIAGDGIEHLSDALNLRDLKLTPRGTDLEITGYPA
jgi:diaminohydroxyphosphoribosylaminopyrimidine deaminase / 5-amino-6-(5-phosphoribosylamino)uracil reductase